MQMRSDTMKCSKEYRLKHTEEARAIVNRLSLEEKVSLMSGDMPLDKILAESRTSPEKHYNYIPCRAGGLPEYNVPPVLFCDGSRGVVCGTGRSTCFPVAMLRGASFDTELEVEIGKAIAKEIRAYGGNLFGGVCLNLPYHPGWGRSQETYGEDSFHMGEMGSAIVEGVQSENVIACLKHFAFNQMEISRFSVNVECSPRTEREVFLSHFKKCIDRGAAAVMSSYNKYKGSYCGHNDYLLNQVLKNKWGFDGFVMSDFGSGVRDTVEAANGGQNIEMSGTTYFGDKLIRAVREGQVSESTIDDAVLRIIRTMISFRDAGNGKYPDSVIGCKEHISLALQSAREGITLIQNRDSLLPLDRKQTKKLVVIGKLATAENLGDHGSSQVFPPYIVTLLEGITRAASESEVIFYEGENLSHAKELAASADAVIVVAGYNYNDEGEYTTQNFDETYTGARGGDRYDLGLHKSEIRLIQETSTANPDTIVVMIGGSTILTSEWQDSVKAILMAYYPGMEGGTALGEILFGDVSPSGKLPFVIPVSQEDLPQIEWETDYQFYEYYHGYEKLEKEGKKPAFHYGFGLSYTDFKIRDASFRLKDHNIAASCLIKNTGSRKGTEVLQLYIGFQNSSVDRPLKSLKGFQRITLDPGEEKEVEILCPLEELKWYRPETHRFELEEMEYNVYIGSSSDDNDLIKGTVNVKEEDQ